MVRAAVAAAHVLLVCVVGSAAFAQAQPASAPPFLIVNQEQLLTESQSGKALLAAEETQRDVLRNEARALDASFEQEERTLTEQRPTLILPNSGVCRTPSTRGSSRPGASRTHARQASRRSWIRAGGSSMRGSRRSSFR